MVFITNSIIRKEAQGWDILIKDGFDNRSIFCDVSSYKTKTYRSRTSFRSRWCRKHWQRLELLVTIAFTNH